MTDSPSTVPTAISDGTVNAAHKQRPKPSKKQRRRHAQKKQALTFLALIAVVALVIGLVLWFNSWSNNRVKTLPADQRLTAVVGEGDSAKEVEVAPYSACEIDDKQCKSSEPFRLVLDGAQEFTLRIPEDVHDHDWAMLKIFDDPGANQEQYYTGHEATEVKVAVDSQQTAEDGSTPKLKVIEVQSLLVGLDNAGDQTPVQVVWSMEIVE